MERICRGCGSREGKGHEFACHVRYEPCDASWVAWAEVEAHLEEANRTAVYHRVGEEFTVEDRRYVWTRKGLQVWEAWANNWFPSMSTPAGHRVTV